MSKSNNRNLIKKYKDNNKMTIQYQDFVNLVNNKIKHE